MSEENMDYGTVTFVDEETGEEIDMLVLDYFFYNGVEYALLTDRVCDECQQLDEQGDCHDEGCEQNFAFAQVITEGDEETFIPIEDEDLTMSLLEAYHAGEEEMDEVGE